MNRALPIVAVLALAGVVLNFAACSSSSDAPPSTAEAGVDEASTPSALSKYRMPTEAGSSEGIRFGEGGAPTACAAKPSPNADIVRACVLRTSCIPDEPPYKISDCISQNLVANGDNSACVKTAVTCNAMNECLDQGFNTKECKYGDHGTHCYDDVIINCDGTPRSYYDCKKSGKTCFLDEDASTTRFPCLGDFAPPPYPDPTIDCSQWNSYPARCTAAGGPGPEAGGGGPAKEWAVYCYSGLTLGVNCSALGKECVQFPDGAECRDKLGAGYCTPQNEGKQSCSGSSLVACNGGRNEKRDCSATGLKCISADDKADCLLAGCTVDDAEKCQESCDGPYANVCVGGGRQVIDCRDYGFRRCQAYTSSAEKYGGDYAVCVFF